MSLVRIVGCGCLVWGLTGSIALSQSVPPPTPKAGNAAATETTAAGRAVVIERAPVLFRDPLKYQVNLHLEPSKKVLLAPVVDGIITTLLFQVGQEVTPQSEVVRFDAQEAALGLKRAQAALKAAKAEVAIASNPDQKAVAEARQEVAEIDIKLADLAQARAVIRSPLKGVVTKVLAVEGEFVRAGQPVVEIIDPREFVVELPVDGRAAKVGETIELKVEDENVPVKIAAVQPLSPQFDALRDLFPSPATGRVILDNSSGKWRAGMTVYSPMIPRNPVAEVPTIAIANGDQGGRKVQVIREGFVRDVPVQLLGQLGTDHVFVTGRFGASDELIQKASETLLDGARVSSREAAKPSTGNTPSNNAPKTGGSAF